MKKETATDTDRPMPVIIKLEDVVAKNREFEGAPYFPQKFDYSRLVIGLVNNFDCARLWVRLYGHRFRYLDQRWYVYREDERRGNPPVVGWWYDDWGEQWLTIHEMLNQVYEESNRQIAEEMRCREAEEGIHRVRRGSAGCKLQSAWCRCHFVTIEKYTRRHPDIAVTRDDFEPYSGENCRVGPLVLKPGSRTAWNVQPDLYIRGLGDRYAHLPNTYPHTLQHAPVTAAKLAMIEAGRRKYH